MGSTAQLRSFDPGLGGHTVQAWSEYLADNPDLDAYMIDPLIASSWTVIYGDPKAGKSMLSLHVAEALASGSGDLWGLPIDSSGRVVGIATTDPGGQVETTRRLSDMNCRAPGRIKLWTAPTDPHDDTAWQSFVNDLTHHGVQVIVLDNLLGLGGGDFNSNAVAASIIKRLKQVSARGIRLVVVAHSRKVGQHSGPSILGSVQFLATFRHIVLVSKQAKATVVKLNGNTTPDLEVRLTRDPETGLLTPEGGEMAEVSKQVRKGITDEQKAWAFHIAANQMTRAAAGRYMQEVARLPTSKAGEQRVDRDLVVPGLLAKGAARQPLIEGPNLRSSE